MKLDQLQGIVLEIRDNANRLLELVNLQASDNVEVQILGKIDFTSQHKLILRNEYGAIKSKLKSLVRELDGT